MAKPARLNVQGLSRRLRPLMTTLVARPGHTFVSVDLSSGEPTVTTHFSQDKYYFAATFGMVGKAPYYDAQGVLMIDDIYLMGMSVSPMGKDLMREVSTRTFTAKDGKTPLSFAEKWLEDKEYIQKSVLAVERPFHKILILGLGYSMGPKHMVEAAYKAGYELSLADAKAFFEAYWKLFSGVKTLGKSLQARFKRLGYLVNPFGYRLVPDKDYKALNYFIQSSVSGVMNVLCAKFFAIAPYARFVTIIHDELITEVPDDKLEEVRIAMDKAVDSLNNDLKWSVNIRTGWAVGKSLYEAK